MLEFITDLGGYTLDGVQVNSDVNMNPVVVEGSWCVQAHVSDQTGVITCGQWL